jgi:hypothetical protein
VFGFDTCIPDLILDLSFCVCLCEFDTCIPDLSFCGEFDTYIPDLSFCVWV